MGVAIIMIVLYGLGLLESNVKESPLSHPLTKSDVPAWTLSQVILILVGSTLGVVWLSEALVHAAEAVMVGLGISEFFLGIILVPIIGNVAEHFVSVQLALKNKMDFKRWDCHNIQPANRVIRCALFGFYQPLAGSSVATHFQSFRVAGSSDCGSCIGARFI